MALGNVLTGLGSPTGLGSSSPLGRAPRAPISLLAATPLAQAIQLGQQPVSPSPVGSGLLASLSNNPLLNIGLSILAQGNQARGPLAGIATGALQGLNLSAQQGLQRQNLLAQQAANRLAHDKLAIQQQGAELNRNRFELDKAKFERGEAPSKTFIDAQRFVDMNGGDLEETYMGIKTAQAPRTELYLPAEKRANLWRERGVTAAVDRRQEIANRALAAADENTKLDQLMALSDEFSGGPVQELLDEGTRWLANAGLEISPERRRAMTAAATTEALTNELAIAYLEGFSGPTTDFEFGVAKQIAGGRGEGTASNRARWAVARAMNDYQQLKEDFFWDREVVAREDPEFDGEKFMKETTRDFYKAHPPREFFENAAESALPDAGDIEAEPTGGAARARQMTDEELMGIAGGQ